MERFTSNFHKEKKKKKEKEIYKTTYIHEQ